MKGNWQSEISGYFSALFSAARQGDAREESFYPALQSFLETAALAHGKKGVQITTLPKPTEAGNPDFRVWDGQSRITGYVEAKAPGANLDQAETSDQLKRYIRTFPNVILTDFYEFRLYRDGVRIARVVAGFAFSAGKLKHPSVVKDADALSALFGQFFSFAMPRQFTSKTLAIELAKRTRFMRDEVVALELRGQDEKGASELIGFYKAFQDFLIANLKLEQFADLYSQTITYGLFAARTRAKGDFNRKTAFELIPRTIGILRDLFRFVSLDELPESLKWMVDDIAEVLANADVKGILDRFYQEGKGRDPIVHFYETFLAEYDPKERERRGVYYTPEPVVGYIVRSIHQILKDVFKRADGLASENVTLLDPAGGTMTFVADAAKLAVAEYTGKYGEGAKAGFIRDHILRDWYAFELMMAPYAVGHLKMSFLLEELGCALRDNDRFKLYLTNTLEFEDLEQTDLPGMRSLSEESHLAGKVKKQERILVILGNPPYSGISSNKGKWITDLIEDYKMVDGKSFGEKKHWLQDDYVKFLRFAQWKIEQAGEGIVGMITNHGYLDNPTFRGMRQSLMRTFDQIHILNLHGNSLKKETCPDGSKDENVFDIRQGVAICLLVKHSKTTQPVVRHSELFGLREAKYDWLDKHHINNTTWHEVKPVTPFYFFAHQETRGNKLYYSFSSVTDIFPVNVSGIVTARDGFVIDFDKEVLLRRIGQFRDLSLTDTMIRSAYNLKDTRGWKLPEERRRMVTIKDWRNFPIQCLHRPFDIRWLYYHHNMIDWGREDIMPQMLVANVALVTPRQHKDEFGALVCNTPGTHKTVAAYDINYYFPLYLYPDQSRGDLFAHASGSKRVPNFPDWLLPKLKEAYGTDVTPENVFHYIYAVLYSPPYREKYNEFLKTDFPRIPFTAEAKVFSSLAKIGEELVALHLLKSAKLDSPIARFHGKGDNLVEKNASGGRTYDPKNQRVYINKEQYFDNIPEHLWDYQIGGYQVLDKWLKDRAERRLSADDVRHYCRVATALSETMRLQRELSDEYLSVEKRLMAFDRK